MPNQIIDLPSCLGLISGGKYHKILVTGPQRSGTHIGAKILADLLHFNYIEESDFGINSFTKFQEKYNNLLKICVQGPAIAHKIHWLNPSWFIVFMYRDIQDIIASQKRIQWKDEHIERNKYVNEFKLSGSILKEPICIIKYRCFSEHQFPTIKYHTAKLNYGSLANHTFWIPKSERPKRLYKK
jgi:hypothetical protein